MMRLQEKLAALGHDVGKVDGILGSGTRAAVQAEQQRLGLPADAWMSYGLADVVKRLEHAADFVVGVFRERGEHFRLAREQALLVGRELVPVPDRLRRPG